MISESKVGLYLISVLKAKWDYILFLFSNSSGPTKKFFLLELDITYINPFKAAAGYWSFNRINDT